MPDAKRPDPKRRSPASRPGKPGGAKRGRQRAAPSVRREPRAAAQNDQNDQQDENVGAIRRSIAESAELQSEERFGSAARRAAILAAVVCVLTLTIAGPVRTYFGQRTEMKQLAATEERLRAQIEELEEQKEKLEDPVYIAAQARERLGFVMPGEIPYQVQLPPDAAVPGTAGGGTPKSRPGEPWYTSLWRTIADEPHHISQPTEPGPPPAPGAPPPPGDPQAPTGVPPGG